MPATSADWNKSTAEKTLDKLRKDYPGYTENEIYGIWCANNQVIPLDSRGKLDLAKWQGMAGEDGKFIKDGGFGVSRAIYGRANKAQKGVAKAKGKPRGQAAAAGAVGGGRQPRDSGLSRTALEFAKKYDDAGRAVEAIQQNGWEEEE